MSDRFNCENIKEYLVGFSDGQLTEDEYVQVEAHVQSCISCRKELRDLESVSSLLSSAPKAELQMDFSENIEALISSQSSELETLASDAGCDEFKEYISPYYDNELDSEKRNLVERHLSVCESCSIELSDIQAVSSVLSNMPRESLGYDFADQIEELIEAEKPKDNVVPFKPRFAIISSIAAIMLLFAVVQLPKLINGGSGDAPQVAVKKGKDESDSSIIAKKVPVTNILNADNKETKNPELQSKVASNNLKENTKAPRKLEASVVSKEQVEKKILQDTIARKEAIETAPKVAMSKANSVNSVVEAAVQEPEQLLSTEAVVAFDSDDDDDLFSQMGVSTDEDGLYAIKL